MGLETRREESLGALRCTLWLSGDRESEERERPRGRGREEARARAPTERGKTSSATPTEGADGTERSDSPLALGAVGFLARRLEAAPRERPLAHPNLVEKLTTSLLNPPRFSG